MPFMKEIGGRLMVNVGSVGQPRDGIAKASYAVLENGEVELKQVQYDVKSAIARLRKLPIDKTAIDELSYILKHAKMPR